MHTQKVKTLYTCSICNFNTRDKKDYNRHISTLKHKKLELQKDNSEKINKNEKTNNIELSCICGKVYLYRGSLYNHQKKCKTITLNSIESYVNINDSSNNILTKDVIYDLVSENNDIKKLLIEQQRQISEQQKHISNILPNIGTNITNNTANIKQRFNINIFLNEQCKDAINMDDFIKQIQFKLNDLDITRHKGLSEGISNIFIENLNKLSVYKRPLHCTDSKRETIYIKDQNVWEKDTDRSKIKQVINSINKDHYKLIQKWIDENPDFKDIEEKQNFFVNLLKNCGADLDGISDKIIKKICISSYLKEELKENLYIGIDE